MRQVVDGVLYDTDKAELIHEHQNGLPTSDFRHLESSLYLTARGRFFLHLTGGPLTEAGYGDMSRGGRHGGSKIVPMIGPNEAAAWLENHDGDDVLINDERFKAFVEEA